MLFLIENNHYSFSTPTSAQYNCRQLSDRAAGLRHRGPDDRRHRRLGGLHGRLRRAGRDARRSVAADPRVHDAAAARPRGLRQGRIRAGRASCEQWRRRDPLPAARQQVPGSLRHVGVDDRGDRSGRSTKRCSAAVAEALAVARPDPRATAWQRLRRFAAAAPSSRSSAAQVKNGEAVSRALDYLLANNPRAFLCGLDVGVYGSAFKTCKGLIERYGPERVIDMPMCESAHRGLRPGRVAGRRPSRSSSSSSPISRPRPSRNRA